MQFQNLSLRKNPDFMKMILLIILLLAILLPKAKAQTTQNFDASTTNSLNSSKWSANNAGSCTTGTNAFTSGNTAVFCTPSGTGSGSISITVGGIIAAQSFTNASGSGTLATAGAVITVSVSPTYTLALGSNFSTTAGTGFIQTGTGTWSLVGQTNAFPGGFTLNSGTVTSTAASNFGSGTLTINGGTLNSTGTQAYANNQTIGGDFTLTGTGNPIFSGTVNLGASNRTITNSTTSGSRNYSGIISGNSNVGLIFAGAGGGTINITGTSNTFTGNIAINGKEVVFSGDGSFGAVPGSATANSIVIDGGRLTLTGVFTLNSNRGIQVGSTAGTSISGGGTYNGIIADKPSSTGILVKQGGSALILGGANTYTGATFINNGTLQLGVNNSLPTGTALSIGQAASANTGIFDLHGFNQEVAGLISNTGASVVTTNSVTSTTSATLTLSGSGSYAYSDGSANNSGVISGAISIVKNGSGTQTLGGANTYTGTTTITGGELRFSPLLDETFSGTATLNGGTLGTTGITASKTLTFSTLSLTDNSIISLGASVHSLKFADSHSISWTSGKTITVNNWTGTADGAHSGTAGKLFFGSTNAGLTPGQLAQIIFNVSGVNYNATILGTGEVVPVCIAPIISSITNNSSICAGSTLSFTSAATTTYGTPTYAWSGPSFTSSLQNPSISNATAAATGTYSVTVTNGCGATATSGITATVTQTVTPSVSIASNIGNTICSGNTVLFTATPTNGGSPSYAWTKNGGTIGSNSATYSDAGLANNDVVICTMTSNATCASPTTASSNTITITVSGSVTPSVSIAPNTSNTICNGTNVTFTATPQNGGTAAYQWALNGGNVGSNSATYSNSTLADGDLVSCVLTSNALCATTTTADANTVTITVTPSVAPSVSIAASTSTSICSGTNVTFTATPTNGGASPAYQWKLNGSNVGTNSTTYSNSTLANNDTVICALTSNATCASPSAANSNAIAMTVTTTVTPTVSIAANTGNTICSGTNVTFTATPTNGGSSPSYQWALNGSNVGTNSATYSNSTLVDGDLVTCILTSNAACITSSTANSNTVTISVTGSVTPSVSIAANTSNTVCSGTNVTFTATPTNGGVSPSYQWKLNGSNVGTNSSTYSNSALANSDVVSCVLTSSNGCASPTTASSNNITFSILNVPSQPGNFTTRLNTFVYQGQSAVAYIVPNVSGATYNWSFNGTGATINGTGNSVTIDYTMSATTGTLTVTANNTCGASTARSVLVAVNSAITIPATNLDYSFVTLGCNRVDYLDTTFSTGDPNFACGKSTANVYQLNRVFTEISHLNPLPKYLVMTGDIVMGYKTPSTADTTELVKQLTAWRAIYESHPLSSMGITVIALPGNHETQNKNAGKTSFVAAEQIFTRVMAPYIHGSNGPGIGGPDGLTTDQSKLTYSFDNGSDHFIIIDTDPVGKDGITPYKWIASDIQAARANNARHIFAFGHKPAYSSSITPAGGLDAATTLSQRDSLWKYLEDNKCEAMFSAHEHLWDTINPHHGKTYQVINGNGGTRVEIPWVGAGQKYYGYTLVNLYTNKAVNVMGMGRNTDMGTTVGVSYPINEDHYATTVRNNFNICLTSTATVSATACINYVWNATTYTTTGTYSYKTTNAAGCDSTTSLNLTITPGNVPSVSIAANTSNTICAGTTVTYTATPTNGGTPSYQWTKNGSNVGTNSATYTNAALANNDAIACTMTSTATCLTTSTASSNTVTMTVNPVAAQPGAFTTSSANVSTGQTGVTYTVPNDVTVTYAWTYSGTGATIHGSGNSITVDFSSSATSGTLSVTATNSCGTGAAQSIAITVSPVFTAGNITVLVENTNTINNSGSIIELNTSTAGQSAINTYSIPAPLRFSNSATSHFLSNSDDGSLLIFTAADTTNTTVDASSVYKRAVGTYNALGAFNLVTTYQGLGGAALSKIRSATSVDNSTFYIGDKSGFYSNGTTSPSPTTNILSTRSFGGTVYALTASSTALAVGTISAATGGTYTTLSTAIHSSGKSNDFYMLSSGNNGSAYDILYILDNSTNGLISKYSLVGAVWTANGAYTTTINGWAIAAQNNGSSANLYVTSGVGTTTNNSVVKLVDAAGYNSNIAITTANNVILYTATGGALIKGIAFAPACAAPAITSVSSNSTVCSGNTLTLIAAVTGSHPTYSWTGPNGFTVASQNPTISNITTAATGTYSLTVTNGCGTASSSTAVTINSSPAATVSAGSNTTFCSGGSATLTAASGASYAWSTGATTQAISATTTANYSVTVIGSNGCSTASNVTSVIVNPTLTPTSTITTNTGNVICAGTNVTFTASITNGGTSPTYQWKLNGSNVGTNSSTYSNSALNDSDAVACILTSNAICLTTATVSSNTITISVSGNVAPSVSISSGSGTTICSGASILFMATPTNAGVSPSYQWKLNSINTGTNSNTYSNSTLADQDVVTCVITSSNSCASIPTATSNSLTMSVNATVTPSVSMGVNPGTTICSGTGVTFVATPINGGTPSYQWTKNGVNVGTNNATYGTNTLVNKDTIVCTMTSTATCRTSNTAVSSNMIMKVNSIPATPQTFTVSAGEFTITRMSVSSDAVNPGQTGVVYTVPNDTTATSYAWTYGGNGATINGSGSSITIDFSSIATRGNLHVTATNSCGTSLASSALPITVLDASQGNIRITEYMYSGTNGEFVEFTNVSSTPVDMTGWSFDDDTRTSGSQNLTQLGIVQPGESVILTESTADSFRLAWNLCTPIKVVGENVNNLGRADEINLYNENTNLVDRLSYDDQTLGGVRTKNNSAWVTVAGLGIDNPTLWILSAVGDSVASVASTGGDVGSPGKSTRSTVAFNPCIVTGGSSSIVIDIANTTNYLDGGVSTSPISPYGISGVIGDATDPGSTLGINFTISDTVFSVNTLTVTVTSRDTNVVPKANLHLTGSGASRNLKITPANIGYSNITLTVNNGTTSTSYVIIYAASANSGTPTTTYWHTGMSDASDGIPLDDSSFVTGDDELNVLNVYSRYHSGLPLVSFNYTPFLNLPDPGKPEADVEVAFKSSTHANRVFFAGSMSNSGDNFTNTPNRDRIFATTITGAGSSTSISVVGYAVLRDKLVAWGDIHGYDFTSSAADGINPKLIYGFDIEGMVMGPDNTTLYVGFRAPLVPMTNRTKAVIAPVLNFETWFNEGSQTGDPTIGNPIELDLGGRGIRDIIRLSNGTYVISTGDPADDDSRSAIFRWTGNPTDAPIQVPSDGDGTFNMEGVMQINQSGQLSLTKLEVINDGGGTKLYTDNAEAKQLSIHNHRKFSTNVLSNLTLGACSTYTPTISASGSTTFNIGHSVVLTANAGTSYLWSNGTTTQSITVTGSGNYSVTVTNSNNCTATSAATNVTVHALVSDVNLDGITNNTDFLLLVSKFNDFCTCPEDMNHDGVVNNTDFLILVGQFNQSYH